MSRLVRWTVGLLLGAVLLAGVPDRRWNAWADDALTKQRLLDAEHDFVDGRIQDVRGATEGGDAPLVQLPVVIGRHWWRTTIQVDGTVPTAEADADLTAQRIAWAHAGAYEPPYPMPSGGGAEDPLPLLSALILDRIHRETIGWYGLVTVPEDGGTAVVPDIGPDSPLQAYLNATGGGRTQAEQDVLAFALAMQWRSYVGDEDPAEMLKLDRKADRVGNQARVIYLGLLGSLLVSAFLATLIVSRDRRAVPGTTSPESQ